MKGENVLHQPNGIDIARSIACFLVVVIHVSGFRFGQFGAGWWASNAYDSMARSSVTVFFMITGALLLSRSDNILAFYKKRVLRIVPPILFWSIVYIALFWSPGEVLVYKVASIFKGPVTTHLWYLYVILGLTVFIPFLGKIYRGSSEIERIIFISIWLICSSVIPVAVELLNMPWSPVNVYGFEPFTGFMGLFFLGAYLYDKRSERSFAWLLLNLFGFIVAGLVIAVSTFLLSVHRGAPAELFYGYKTLFVVLSAVCLFNFCISLPVLSGFPSRLVRNISDCSLGIYCIHPMVIYFATKWWGGELVIGWLSVAIMSVSVFVVSALIVRAGRIFPFLRYVS